jgi:hypothetical protein
MESIAQEDGWMDRRRFIRLGAYLTIMPLLGLDQFACSRSAPAEITDWHLMSEAGDGNGKLIIDQVEGEALLNGSPLRPGMEIPGGQSIDVRSGIVLASLPDQSIIKLSQRALLSAVLDSQKGGILQLQRGGLLAVVRKSTAKPYLVRNASALVGVKGTVFYTQVLSAAEKVSNSLPQAATDYFCICNGDIDILTADFSKIKSDSAVHHNAYFFMPQSSELTIKRVGFLLNHSDLEISNLIKRMKGAKHNTNWLFPEKSGYSD